MYSMNQHSKPMATAAAAGPGLLTQVGMAGTAAVITVSFIHPLDVIKVCRPLFFCNALGFPSELNAGRKTRDSFSEVPFQIYNNPR
jgi:hypothetical protein